MTRTRIPILRTSERSSFRRCPQQWWWSYRMGFSAKKPAIQLWFGTLIHIALAAYFIPGKKRGPHPAETFKRIFDDEYRSIRVQLGGDNSDFVDARDLGVAMLEGYVEKWGDDKSWNVIHPEWSAQVDVPDLEGNVIARYALTVDGVYFDDEDGKFKIMEHKTAARIETKHLTMDDQAGSYLPFMTAYLQSQGLLKPKQEIETITYDFLRKDVPRFDDRPVNEDGLRLNKDGTVSKRQSDQAPLFVRTDVTRTRHERRAQVDRIRREVEAMNWFREDPDRIYKNTSRDCSWCPFFDVCELDEAGGDWETLREWGFTKRDPYSDHRQNRKAA